MNARGLHNQLVAAIQHIAPLKPEEKRGKEEDLEKDTTVDFQPLCSLDELSTKLVQTVAD
jgi:hypothetical protein